jgi:hypothetical protein
MKPMEEREIDICQECGGFVVTNGKGMNMGDGHVELEVKSEECGSRVRGVIFFSIQKG